MLSFLLACCGWLLLVVSKPVPPLFPCWRSPAHPELHHQFNGFANGGEVAHHTSHKPQRWRPWYGNKWTTKSLNWLSIDVFDIIHLTDIRWIKFYQIIDNEWSRHNLNDDKPSGSLSTHNTAPAIFPSTKPPKVTVVNATLLSIFRHLLTGLLLPARWFHHTFTYFHLKAESWANKFSLVPIMMKLAPLAAASIR